MEFLEAANEKLIIWLILLAHRFPVPIDHCLIAGLRCIELGQLLGEAPVVIFASSIVVGAHGLLLLRCLTSSAMSCASTQLMPGGGPIGVSCAHPVPEPGTLAEPPPWTADWSESCQGDRSERGRRA